MLVGVIIAGGRGERFWPKSRKNNPKQLLDIFTGTPLIKETVQRISKKIKIEDTYIITNQIIASKIKATLPTLSQKNIIAEPIGRNTGPAIGVMAVYLRKRYGNPTILIATADHLIPDSALFMKHALAAAKVAEKYKALVTFGIHPTYPETGFGYIKSGKEVEEINGIKTYKVAQFLEKPDLKKAQAFVKNPKYTWNSGMFCWTCDAILEALEKYMPDLYQQLMVVEKAIGTKKWPSILKDIYPQMTSVPIDKGVMEKADNAMVLKSNFEWHDIGSWVTLGDIRKQDTNGNIQLGNTCAIDTCNSIIVSDNQLIATVGISDLIIVSTGDALVICPKDKAQDIKKIVQALDKDAKFQKYL